MLAQKAFDQHLWEETSFPNIIDPKLKTAYDQDLLHLYLHIQYLNDPVRSFLLHYSMYFYRLTLPYICHDTKKLSSSPSRPHPYPSKIYKFKNKVKTNKQTKKHLEAVGNYGENQRGIWRKEEV